MVNDDMRKNSEGYSERSSLFVSFPGSISKKESL